ncbi:HAMP domain-containing histidine kinase, partial [Patescibacteria group bacterium]|nr:HAMP domain-containing histidine kinase [Patescibacteria group bacterium]
KEKDDFLFRTVHDLRSPSNTVRLILEKYAKSDFLKRYPELKEDISIIQELDARMLQLVNDLLLVGKGEEAGTLVKKEKVDISLIIQQVLNECSAIAAVKNIKFRYDPPADLPFVAADTGLVSEVVLNLVDNAIKYNKPGGDVIISHAVMNGFLETAIQDTGIGIAPENTDNLFKPYFRGEQSGKIRGTGLGLYIVKRLVEKMNGSVGISSLVGQGTKITFSLPMVTEKG